VLRFSPQNSKTKKLTSLPWARKWLKDRKVYSFDLLSGWNCPFALECKSKAIQTKDGLRIKNGPNCKFRCFSAAANPNRRGDFALLVHGIQPKGSLWK